MSKLLDKQINKLLGARASEPELQRFLNAIRESYNHYERDRELIERSLAISSEEMRALYTKLKHETDEHKLAMQKLLETLKLLNLDFISNDESLSKNIIEIADIIKNESAKRKSAEQTLKQNVNNLEKINKDLDQFAYVVSHDLKAPLRAIASLAEWIEEDAADKINADTTRNLQLLRGRVQRMENLIHGILAYTKAGKIKGELQLINTTTFIHEIIEFLNPPTNIEIRFEGDWPEIETDTIRFHQVLSNLISNSIKYIDKPNGIILIKNVVLEHCCQISIEDNGPGIEEEYHQKIFQLFQTLSARDHVESTGIGLSIVKKIVEEQGGKIWVDSIPGKSSRFTFTWPTNIVRYNHLAATNHGR
jgi:signal transduction histidine kinase